MRCKFLVAKLRGRLHFAKRGAYSLRFFKELIVLRPHNLDETEVLIKIILTLGII